MESLAQHIFTRQAEEVGLKTAIMEYAAMARGVPYRRVDRTTIIVDPSHGHSIPFLHMNGPASSEVGKRFCGIKSLGGKLLGGAGLRVPKSRTFSRRGHDKAWFFAESLPTPFVVKPNRLSRGLGVSTNVGNAEQFEQAWSYAFDAYRTNSPANRVIIEEQITGEDYRCFVVDGKFISATQRRRPSVQGDGNSSLLELILAKNETRAAHPTLNTYPIPTELVKLDLARAAHQQLDYVPNAGQVVTLRSSSNLSGGGDSVDCTDQIHDSFKNIAVQAYNAIPGMKYLGVDLIATDITAVPTLDNHAVTEVEYSPGPITDFPVVGKSRDMAGAILEYYMGRG